MGVCGNRVRLARLGSVHMLKIGGGPPCQVPPPKLNEIRMVVAVLQIPIARSPVARISSLILLPLG